MAALLVLSLGLVACDSNDPVVSANIVATAQADPELSVLVQAVTAANLGSTLSSADANLTVFAPTNAAFAALAQQLGVTQAQLLARADLGNILLYHVAAGRLRADDLTQGRTVQTQLSGRSVTVVRTGGTVGLDTNGDGTADSRVTTANIEASNGVIHKIDAVLVP